MLSIIRHHYLEAAALILNFAGTLLLSYSLYEVEEQLYVVRLPDLDPENNYINYDLDEDCFDVGCKWESAWDNPKDDVYVDQFPMYVIEERLPKYVQYAEKVWQ